MKQMLNTLYISKDDIYVSYKREAIEVVEKTGENPVHIPFHEIESIVVFGNARIDEAIYVKCAEKGISIIFFTAIGKFKYRVVGETRGNVIVRKKQYFLSEDDARIKLSNEIIAGKIINSMNTIDRFMRNHKELKFNDTLDNLQNLLLRAKKCNEKAMYEMGSSCSEICIRIGCQQYAI